MTKMKSVLACVCAVLMIALAVVPMFTLSASAAEATATLSFASTANRVSQDSNQQVWSQNGIIFTNDKASSSTSVANYSNPVRLYAGSSVTIETTLGKITKIVAECSSSTYATDFKNSVGDEATVSGSNVTITLSTPANSYKIDKLTKQIRIKSLDVTYEVAADACKHLNKQENVTVEPTCTSTGIKTITCLDCGETLSPEILDKIDHTFVDGVCSECGSRDSYEGTYYIATKRSSGNYFYMTNDLGSASTKRYQAVDSKLTVLPETITAPDSAYVFTVEKRDGGYVISTVVDGSVKYLTWSSGNSGNLDTEAKAKVMDFQTNADGTVKITIENGIRKLGLNNNSGSDYFAWYESDQANKLALIPVVQKEEVNPEILGANLNIGNDLTMKYHVVLPEGADVSKYSMQFTLNEKTVTVTACVAGEGEYVFAFEGIAPQLMGDTIVAKLLCDGAEVDTYDYSVKEYAIDTMADHPEYKTLLSDLLAYGAAAQTYRNYKTDALVNVDVDGYEPSATAPVLADKVTTLTESTSEVASFTAAGVYFDYTNKIYVKLTATTLEGVVVKVNGTAVDVEAYGNGYIAYSEAVSALDFGKTFTVTLEVGGEVVQTLTYSINSYVYTKCANAGAEPTAMQALALALYRYGASALAANA